MRVIVLLCFVLLRTGGIEGSKLCDAGLCACERARGKFSCSCTSHSKETTLNTSVVPEGTSHLRIENCSKVLVKSHTWEGHREIRLVELFNIKELKIESNAFSWNETLSLDQNFQLGLSVNIYNSSIIEIPSFAFKGRIKSITLNNVTIGRVNAFAFASLYNTHKLELINCIVRAFEAQAFKKFAVDKLYITGGYFSGSVPSRTMLDLEVYNDLFIDKLTVDTIRSSAFSIRRSKVFHLRDCYFHNIEGEAFHVKTAGKTFIQSNVFLSLAKGAFAHIKVEQAVLNREGPQELRFENNTIGKFENGCLIFDASFDPQMDHVVLNQVCSCALLDSWSAQLSAHSPELNSEHRKQKLQPHSDPSNPANPFWCQKGSEEKKKNSYIRFHDFSEQCLVSSGLYVFLIIIVTSSLGLLVVILLIIFYCRRRRARNQKRWINVPTSPNNENNKSQKVNNKGSNVEAKSKNGQDSRITMVVPDGRTYRETELHVIVERTEPLIEPEFVDTAINERGMKKERKNLVENQHECESLNVK